MSTVCERQRLDPYERLGETLGREHAEVLMEYLPPVGWNDVVRRHDLDIFRAEVRADLADMRTEMAGLRVSSTSSSAASWSGWSGPSSRRSVPSSA